LSLPRPRKLFQLLLLNIEKACKPYGVNSGKEDYREGPILHRFIANLFFSDGEVWTSKGMPTMGSDQSAGKEKIIKGEFKYGSAKSILGVMEGSSFCG